MEIDLLYLLEGAVALLLLVLGVLAIRSKDVIHALVYLSVLSMLSVLAFLLMQAPDVAITEAVIGAGLVTAIFLFTLLAERPHGEAGDKE